MSVQRLTQLDFALRKIPGKSIVDTMAVRRGEVLGAIGNSGDAREAHLHFLVTNGPDILASEGLPYVIDRFRMKRPEGSWQERRNDFPLGNAIIEFDGR